MFYISQSFYTILSLVLIGIAKFALDVIHNNSSLKPAFPQEDYELNSNGGRKISALILCLCYYDRFKVFFWRNMVAKAT